jgi:HSP20 family protein
MSTSLLRRNPFGATDPFASRMWDWFTTPAGQTPMSRLFGETGTYIPPTDIYETREQIVVAVSLPAVDAGKLTLEVKDNELTIAGEQQPFPVFHAEEGATQYLAGIPRYGKFRFSFQLPVAVDAEQAQADYINGLLCMRFHKSQKYRPTRIPVQSITGQPQVTSAPAEISAQTADQPEQVPAEKAHHTAVK